MKAVLRPWYAVMAILALTTGCAGAQRASPDVGAAPIMHPVAAADPADVAEQVGTALAMAAEAERRNDTAALARAALQLEQLGARPQTDSDNAALQRWRSALPATAPPMRGRALGPAYRSGKLGPGTAMQLNQTFLGGRSAQIIVRVAHGTVPSLVVHDQSDRQVCAARTDPIRCRWVPLYTQRHRIEMVNSGNEMSQFFVVFD